MPVQSCEITRRANRDRRRRAPGVAVRVAGDARRPPMLGPSSPLPSSSAWARLAGGGVLSPVWCSSYCIVLLLFCFQVMTAASAPTTYVTPPAASSVLPPLVARPSPPPWVQRMQADDTSPNKRSVAMWGGNQSTKYLVTSKQWTLIVTDNGTVMGVRAKEKRPTFGECPFSL